MASSATQILEDVKNGKCSVDEAQKQLAQMKLADLKTLTYKVSPKGAISFYGIRRMPISLYLQELEEIIRTSNTEEFKKFISENTDKLSKK
uniref:Uncharacterized protein n=1 Tax=viral metagenome TaxID=1070528 RepID=A0A6C0BMC7_9ZZZZ